MPLSELVAATRVVAAGCSSGTPGEPTLTLKYRPATSRGTLVREFLLNHRLPGAQCLEQDDGPLGRGSGARPGCVALPTLCPLFYAGYNLLTCDSRFSSAAPDFVLHYTTNRNGAQYRYPADQKNTHCPQNSYLDNWNEPKCALLRDCFVRSLQQEVDPHVFHSDGELDIRSIASVLADRCLCLQPQFDLLGACQMELNFESKTRSTYKEILDATNPMLGLTDEDIMTCFVPQCDARMGLEPEGWKKLFGSGGSDKLTSLMQSNMFSTVPEIVTRTQSVVLTQRPEGCGRTLVHVLQRECDGPASFGAWAHFVSEG